MNEMSDKRYEHLMNKFKKMESIIKEVFVKISYEQRMFTFTSEDKNIIKNILEE